MALACLNIHLLLNLRLHFGFKIDQHYEFAFTKFVKAKFIKLVEDHSISRTIFLIKLLIELELSLRSCPFGFSSSFPFDICSNSILIQIQLNLDH